MISIMDHNTFMLSTLQSTLEDTQLQDLQAGESGQHTLVIDISRVQEVGQEHEKSR